MKGGNIFILSDSIRSGKTTLVQHWLSHVPFAGGVLAPDVDGIRQIVDIATGEQFQLQVIDSREGIEVGKFVFSKEVFFKANEILLSALHANFSWLIVDEVGKLELHRHMGLEPALSKVIEHFRSHDTQTTLLLLIRDYLLDEAINRYQLHHAKILSRSFFANTHLSQLNGIVLCGGESKRMKQDKALLCYHQKPQFAHVYELLQSFCDDVVLSINEKQQEVIPDDYTKVVDKNTFQDAGPMTGLLSALENHSNTATLVVGCDYPYLKRADLLQLFNARKKEADAVCFINEAHFAEPLIAIYEPSCTPLLKEFYETGGRSLQQFLKKINTIFIHPVDPQCLVSVDDMDMQEQYWRHARAK